MENGRIEPLREVCLQPLQEPNPKFSHFQPPFRGVLGGVSQPLAAAPTDPWKWGGAIGAWILSPAQVDALNPKPRPSSHKPKPETLQIP